MIDLFFILPVGLSLVILARLASLSIGLHPRIPNFYLGLPFLVLALLAAWTVLRAAPAADSGGD